MRIVTKALCKALGGAGLGVAVYDACKISKMYSHIGSEHAEEEYLQDVYYSSRTTDKISYTDNEISKKAFNIRSKLPLHGLIGKIKGFFKGFMYGLGNHLPLVALSALAIVGKNWLSKAGAIGVGLLAVYKILKEGFGLGKNNPMD